MLKSLQRLVVLALIASITPNLAQADDKLVVFIECTSDDGDKSQGSGVLVSADGHVLTARHVVPKGASCMASVGNSTRQKRGIRPSFESRKIDDDFDALLLEFGKDPGETFPFATVCPVDTTLKQSAIIAKGFHADSFGGPSATDGILSNTSPNFDGIIETSAMTINGKSGGPVFLEDTDALVGIIAGAKFTATGVVSFYGMLAINAIVDELSMLTKECGKSPTAPSPPVIENLPLYNSSQTYHIGDEEIRSWAPLVGACLQIPLTVPTEDLKKLTLSSQVYGAENTYLLADGLQIPFHRQSPKPNKTRPNFWSPTLKAEFEVKTAIRNVSICSKKVFNPDNANDLDDFQIRNIKLNGEFHR